MSPNGLSDKGLCCESGGNEMVLGCNDAPSALELVAPLQVQFDAD